MAATAGSSGGRLALYGALRRRNRMVTLLRVLVPLIGLVVLAVLGGQLVLSNLTKDFSIGRISLERDRLRVDAPTYAGRLGDDSIYTVTADSAEAALGATNLIDLLRAKVVVNRTDGVRGLATAAAAQLDSDKQLVDVAGITQVSDSTGNTGTLEALHIDFPAQTLSAGGAVHMVFAKGETLDAESMHYDAAAKLWRFSGVVLTLPSTPGEAAP